MEKLKCQHIAKKDLFQMEIEEEIESIESNLSSGLWYALVWLAEKI